MDRRTFLINSALATATLLPGCATTNSSSQSTKVSRGQKGKREDVTKTGFNLDTTTEEDHKFNSEAFGVEGILHYATDINSQYENQLPFAIYRRSDTMQHTFLTPNRTRFEPTIAFIPTLVEDGLGGYVDAMHLKMYGPHGNRADITQYGDLGKKLKKLNGLSTVKLTEKNARYILTTLEIPGHGKFFMVGDATTPTHNREEVLDYFMIPVEGAEMKINYSNGRITLINKNNIFMPKAMDDLQLKALHEEQEVIGRNPVTQTNELVILD